MKKNSTINWVNFLHIYQPPWQDRGVVEQISSQSYEYLLALLSRFSEFRMTLNITGNLLEQLYSVRPYLIKLFQAEVKRGRIELTGSAKYHALLPLLPEGEVIRQIKLNQETQARFFDTKKIKGFFLPEMAYSPQVAKIVKKMGYSWIIVDPIIYKGQVDNEVRYKLRNIGLEVVFRDREISKLYPPEEIYKMLQKNFVSKTIISAHDGETYGHFHNDWQGHIEKVIMDQRVKIQTVGQYLSQSNFEKNISLKSGTWETDKKDLQRGKPWLLWSDPKNKIHRRLWELVRLCVKLINKYSDDPNIVWARQHLDQGLSSCSFWWSTGKKPSAFSSLTWSPDMIDNGAEELITVVRSLVGPRPAEKIRAEKLYLDIQKNTWITHWKKYNK